MNFKPDKYRKFGDDEIIPQEYLITTQQSSTVSAELLRLMEKFWSELSAK